MLRRLFVLVVVMTWTTETKVTNSDVTVISAKPTEEVRFDCRKRSDEEIVFWKIKTKTGTGVERNKCDELISDPIDVRKRCVDETYGYDLIITKVNEDDEGIYECTGRMDDDVIAVYVFKLKKAASVPERNYTKDATFREGSTANLWCNASGQPPPSVKWQVINVDINGRDTADDIGIQGNLLQIQNVSRHCSTSYRCIASNDQSRKPAIQNIKIRIDFGAMADLDIYSGEHCGTTMDDLGEKIQVNGTGSHYVEKREGEKVSLVCSGSGSPNATIEWLRYYKDNLVQISALGHGNKINDNNTPASFVTNVCPSLFKDERRFRLTFLVFDDKFATYVCRASNEYGNDEMTITIKKST